MFRTFASVAVFFALASAKAIVKSDKHGPTGYAVEFRYSPPPGQPQPKNVTMGSGFSWTDPLHTTFETAANYPPSVWKPGYINLVGYEDLITGRARTYDMKLDKSSGDWVLALPFPSGTFSYSFLVDCALPVVTCQGIADPENPPIEALAAEQSLSIVQVPFDSHHQRDDYTWQLPLENKSKRGTVKFMNYSSPGSTHPAKDVHSAGVYLPPGYRSGGEYHVVYFHHGRGGNHADWFNQGRLHQIVDRLIASKAIPPVILITPNFYDLGFTPEEYATNVANTDGYGCSTYDQTGIYAFDHAVRENYFKYLMPWVEKNFAGADNPANRSFVGLSMGGGLATEMLYNATDYFGSYGIFSQSSVEAFSSKKLLYGAGLYDFALPSTLDAESVLPQAGVKQILSHIPACGGHSWCVWQELAYVFLKDVLFA